MFFERFQKQQPVGINISESSVEVLQLNKKRQVLAYGSTPLPAGIIEKGRLIKREELLAKLKEALAEAQPHAVLFKGGKVQAVISIPKGQVYMHEIKGFILSGVEGREAVAKEAAKIIPYNPEEMAWDYVAQEGKAVYAGVPREVLQAYLGVLREMGIQPIAVDAEVLAKARAPIETPQAVVTGLALRAIENNAARAGINLLAGMRVS